MTIDELIQRHPLPYTSESHGPLGCYEIIADAKGEKITDLAQPYAQAICDAMQELVRLRDRVERLEARHELDARACLISACNAVQNNDELAALRARNAELEAYVVRMRGAPERLAEVLPLLVMHQDPEHESTLEGCARCFADATANDLINGGYNAAIYGEGGAL